MVYLPGGGGVETSWQGGTDTNPSETGDVLRDCTDRLTYHRRVVTLPTDWTWGDDEMITRIDDMFTYAEANYGFDPPYHLIAVSMGTCCAFNWAVNNLDKVQSISCMLPAVDLQDIEDTVIPVYPAIVAPSVAYGTSSIPSDHDPSDYAASLSDVPIKLWYSTNDTVVHPATVTAFAAASGATLQSIGNQSGGFLVGHGLDSGFVYSQVADWLITND